MKVKKILTIVLIGLFFFAGCKKDKKEDDFDYYIKYDGKMFRLDKGAMENYGKYYVDDSYSIDLWFLSEGLKMIEINGEWDHESGKGHIVYFEMNTNSPSQIDNGTYTYDLDETYDAGTFLYGDFTLNYDADHNTWETYKAFVDGTVTVSRTGDVYEITFNCTDEDGKTVTGYYKGTLIYYDYDTKKSTRTEKRKPKF